MTINEKRIEFVNLKFFNEILTTLGSRGLTVREEDRFILSMSWPWRAPDRSDFNSSYILFANEVVVINGNRLTREGEIGIPLSEQLRIRTIPQGNSTVRFSLIYADMSKNDSPVVKVLEAIGGAVIGTLTGGISSIILRAGAEAAAGYNLERMVESVSNKKDPEHILGRASLEFNGQEFLGQKEERTGMTIISLENSDREEIVKLWIKTK